MVLEANRRGQYRINGGDMVEARRLSVSPSAILLRPETKKAILVPQQVPFRMHSRISLRRFSRMSAPELYPSLKPSRLPARFPIVQPRS